MAIILKSKVVPALARMNSLALKYIFDKSHLTLDEERSLNEGIEWWVKKVDLTAYEKRELQAVIDCLIQNKEGRFDLEKHEYKRGDIDYRKVYREGI